MADSGKGCGCGGKCDGGRLERRDFLKAAGLGVMSTSLLARSAAAQDAAPEAPAAVPEAAPPPPPPVSHFVQAEKNLSPEWIKALYERGAKEVFRGEELPFVGMPVGGIGTGQLYLCGDGTLGCWEIFNNHEFKGTGDRNYAGFEPARPVDQGFAAIVEADGQRTVRALTRGGFSDITFTGEYPIGRVLYKEPGFPVEVELEAFSPFIPLNARDSALPATILNIRLKNTSDKPVAAGLAAWLENAVCRHSATEIRGLRRTRTINENGRTLVLHTAEDAPPVEERAAIPLQDFEGPDYKGWQPAGEAFGTAPAAGALPGQQPVAGFEGAGLVNSFLTGDAPQGSLVSPAFTIERRYLNFLIGGGAHKDMTCINLIVDEAVVRTATGKNEEALQWQSWRVEEFEGKQARIEIVDKSSEGWGHINIDSIELADARRQPPAGPVTAQADFGTLVLALGEDSGDTQTAVEVLSALDGLQVKQWVTANEPFPFTARHNAAMVTGRGELAPGAERVYQFVLAWHFANAPQGHEYAVRFADAPAVAHYVFDNMERLARETRTWRDTYYDSTLPYWLLDRLHSTVSTLATGTSQWWRNGRFWAWEGVVCCGGTCAHVWNYSHAEARLFPELARSVREMQDFAPWTGAPEGGGFHPDTGLVGFRSDSNYAADGQCGTILKAYREHCTAADGAYLTRQWPQIKKALEFSIQQDAVIAPGEPDGLIENSQHNTYDINFEGPNTFVGALYLAALRAGEEMAREMGDTAFADRCRSIFESGKARTLERLWNGEYFVQQVDLAQFPKHQYGDGCLADQLFGQGWAHQVRLGHLYPPEQVKQALLSVWTYNWATDVGPQNEAHKPLRWFVSPGEAGLFTCTWPKSPYLADGVIYKEEVWTGIEYQVAGHMVWEGLVEQGLALCRAVHERYAPKKRNPYNEVECGDHYARAMASWGVLLALAGYEYHGPQASLAFAPRVSPESFKCAFTAAEGWGTFSQQREGTVQRERFEMRWGSLRVKTLTFTLPDNAKAAGVTATVDGNAAECAFTQDGARVQVALTQDAIVNAGGVLAIEIASV